MVISFLLFFDACLRLDAKKKMFGKKRKWQVRVRQQAALTHFQHERFENQNLLSAINNIEVIIFTVKQLDGCCSLN